MVEQREGDTRAWRCKSYAFCISEAAKADLPELPGCPCDRFELDREAVTWRSVAACQHLILAALVPDAWEVFLALRAARDNGAKWKILSRAAPTLGLRKKDIS